MEGVALQSRVGSTHHLYLGTRHPARSTQHSRAPLRGIKRCRALSDDDDKPGPEDGTSSIVQDALVGMIRLEIGKKQVESFVEEEGDKLKQIAEEAKEEMDRLAEEQALKAEQAFDSAWADIDKEAADFEEQLKKSREELLSNNDDFEQWEQDMAVSRSEGQFFQSLYQKDKKRPAGADAEQLKERARRVTEPAQQEINSPIRIYLFMFLSAILVADVVLDLMSDEPSALSDVLYTVLAFLAGWLAYNERKSMMR